MSAERVPPGLSALEVDYEIIREIGRGGTSVVYLARERATGAEVALKLIRSKYLGDDEAMGRFAREARFLERLVHPNIVRVRAVVELGDAGLALVMAHVPGRTLKQLILDEGRLAPDRVERFTRDIARALDAAHAMGIVHRDVKPENIFIDDDDRPLLADFGLARSMTGDSQLTMAGVAIGTPAYMAPEQIEGASLDARGDVYSLGLVAWEMLTGHRPWEGESLYAVLYHQRFEQLPDVREIRSDVPDALAETIAVAIEKNPVNRWQSVSALIEALDGASPRRGTPVRSRSGSDTVRFVRPARPPAAPTPPAPAPPPRPLPTVELGPASVPAPRHEPSFVPASTLASIAAELDAQDEIPANRTTRRYAFALGGLVATATIVLLAVNVQGRSTPRQSEGTLVSRDFSPNDSAGKPIGATSPANASAAKDSTRAAPPPAAAPTVAAPAASVASANPTPPSLSVSGSPPPKRAVEQQSTPATTVASARRDSAASRSGANDRANDRANDKTSQKSVDKPATDKPDEKRAVVEAGAVRTAKPAGADSAPAAAAPALSSRVTVAAGGLHSCLVSADGRAYCWGGNDRGQLGAGTANAVSAPRPVAGDVRFSTIVAGLSHTCAIARSGGAWCWGENESGQLGDRSTMAHQAPMRVADSRTFVAIAVGAAHTCALDVTGGAWCWGSNSHGQLGSSNDPAEMTVPAPVAGDRRFSSIALGWNFACGLENGRAYCWGENSSGQLGDGSAADRRVPVPVQGGLSFRSIATGNTHACGIVASGEAYCWGNNVGGQLGDGTRVSRGVPAPVKTSLRFVAITAGALHTCGLTRDGEAFCWGRDNYGQLGDGGSQEATEPARVSGEHSFASIHAFGSHTCATTTSGDVFCWGYNLDGQLGDGSRSNRARPVYVELPPGTS